MAIEVDSIGQVVQVFGLAISLNVVYEINLLLNNIDDVYNLKIPY